MTSPWYNPRLVVQGTRVIAEAINAELTKIKQAFDLLPDPNEVGVGAGQPNYTWFAWADSADGTANFTTVAPGNRAYLGTASNKTTAIPSNFPEDYRWTRIVGPAGTNGPALVLQYSINGIDNWHTPFVAGDKFWRQSVDGGLTFSPSARLTAETLAQLDLAAANALAAAGADIVALQSSVGTVSASVTAEASTRANADSALATSIGTVSTTVAGHTASIATYATSISGLQAKAGISIDVNGHIVGWELNNGGGSGEAIFRVDKFKITSASGNSTPFQVVGSDVFIKSAIIENLTITTQKLAVNATFASGVFSADFGGYRNGALAYNTWTDVQDGSGTKAQFTVTTGPDGSQRVLIDAVLTLARDGSDDDNTSWRVIRSDMVLMSQIYTNVQIDNNRRQYAFAFYDDAPAASQNYTYTLQYAALPSDGRPYFHNVVFRGVVLKK
jgi:hypothetical protein